ncbi:MAG: hydroxymethylglutaryl-CoA synthase [Candidatus Aenigmatarchaeota archaeon]
MFGITGWGCYVPRYRIKVADIAHAWERDPVEVVNGLGVLEKAVAGKDEDSITMAVEAGRNALARAGIDKKRIGALFMGSESHPYVVKPSGTVVAEALGLGSKLHLADLEFACKAGTAGMQICNAFVRAGQIEFGIAIGSDAAQGRPGDALEYTAGSGAAAFVIGKDPVATLDDTISFTTDTTDFWRKEGKKYPSHAARFTGEPGYFNHVISATKMILEKTGMKSSDFDHVIFHMPNAKFPQRVFKMFDIPKEKFLPGLVVTRIGNTYSGSSMIGLAAVLDIAKPGQKILMTSYGSGAGSDSFVLTVTDKILDVQNKSMTFEEFVTKKTYVDYATYIRMRGKLYV